MNPVWHEVVSFEITTGKDDLVITIIDKDLIGSGDFEGRVVIHMDSLRDQLWHDQFYTLQAEDPTKPWQGKIHLALQWIWNKTKFYQSLVEQWEEGIAEKSHEIANLQLQLVTLQEPFGFLSKPVPVFHIDQPAEQVIKLAKVMESYDHIS